MLWNIKSVAVGNTFMGGTHNKITQRISLLGLGSFFYESNVSKTANEPVNVTCGWPKTKVKARCCPISNVALRLTDHYSSYKDEMDLIRSIFFNQMRVADFSCSYLTFLANLCCVGYLKCTPQSWQQYHHAKFTGNKYIRPYFRLTLYYDPQ